MSALMHHTWSYPGCYGQTYIPIFSRSRGRGGLPSGRHSGACTSPGSTSSNPSKNAVTCASGRGTNGAVAFSYVATACRPTSGGWKSSVACDSAR
jgi:hypothetical protein